MELYVLGAVVSFVLGTLLRMPVVPRNKFSFEPTALFPTVPLVLGFTAILDVLTSLTLPAVLSLSVAVPLFVKYLLKKLCPVVEC